MNTSTKPELRDRRIARAMISALADNSTCSSPISIEFCIMDEPFEFMMDLCKEADWNPSTTPAMQAGLSSVARHLYKQGVLKRGRLSNGELEYRNSPRWQYSYYLAPGYLVDINPGRWGPGGAFTKSEVRVDRIELILDDIWPRKSPLAS